MTEAKKANRLKIGWQIKNRRLVATLYGGIYNSKPYKSDVEKWFKAPNGDENLGFSNLNTQII